MSQLARWGLVVVVGWLSANWCGAEELLIISGVPSSEVPAVQSVDTLVVEIGANDEGISIRGGDAIASPLQAANAQRLQLITSLQALQDAYCRNAQLDEAVAVREMIRQLQQQATEANSLPDPVMAAASTAAALLDVRSLRGQNEVVVYCPVTGTTADFVWGGEGNIYTDDSRISSAAVHAGVLKAGETAIVRITILTGQASYPAVTRNGITSRPWQAWGGSFRVDGASPHAPDVYSMRGQDQPPFAVYLTGSTSGTVWGSDSYTDDSDLSTAAVHAGLLKAGESGFVLVTLEGGKSAYEGSTQSGITTRPYSTWEGSFRLSAIAPAAGVRQTQYQLVY